MHFIFCSIKGLEVPCDAYFEYDDVTLEYVEGSSNSIQPSTGLSKVVVKPSSSEEETVSSSRLSIASVSELGCLASTDESQVVLNSLLQVIYNVHMYLYYM